MAELVEPQGNGFGPPRRWERCSYCRFRCRTVYSGNATEGQEACSRCYHPLAEAYKEKLDLLIANAAPQGELGL